MKDPFVNLFNCDNQKYISQAPIKSQASISHFYDDDSSIEKLLSVIENSGGLLNSVAG